MGQRAMVCVLLLGYEIVGNLTTIRLLYDVDFQTLGEGRKGYA